jgi:hypothetical protein
MEIWQRGTTFAVGALTYTADRWQGYRATGGGTTVSRQTGTTGFQYAARIQRDSGNASTTNIQFGQNFESSNSYELAGQTITFSFYARAGANFSAASSNLNLQVITGTGTDQNFITGYTGAAIPINTTKTLTTSWQRFQSTATLSSSLTQVGVNFYYTPVGTASTNDWFEVTGVQIEVGSIATPFKTAMGTIQAELAACQRYYWKMGGDNVYQYLGMGAAVSATETRFLIPNPVEMRVKPTALEFSTLAVYDVGGAAFYAATAVTNSIPSKNTSGIIITVASGLTTQRPFIAVTNNSLSGYLAFTAEL